MRRILTLFTGVLVVLLGLASPAAANHRPGPQRYTFVLATPATAVAAQPGDMAAAGDRITVTGGGTFTPAAGSVDAGGSFVHYGADGSEHCRGSWTATALTGWTDFGPAGRGRHGGVVSLVVSHACGTMGEVHAGIPMTVTAAVHAPGPGYVNGVTVGEFTVPTAGRVVIRARP